MSSNSFAKYVYGLGLSRKDNFEFTTGDSDVDKTLSLDNGAVYGNPESDAQVNFAALVYLFGLFGGKCTAFTAIPFGYLCEMDFDGKKGLHIVAEGEKKVQKGSFLEFNIEQLINYIQEYKEKTKKLTPEELSFCDYVLADLKSAKNKNMLEILHDIAIELKVNSKALKKFRKNLSTAKAVYNETNSQNCTSNRNSLEKIIEDANHKINEDDAFLRKRLMIGTENLGLYVTLYQLRKILENDDVLVDEEDREKLFKLLDNLDQIEKDYVFYKDILDWIIKGYLSYHGKGEEEILTPDKKLINDRLINSDSMRRIFGDDFKRIMNGCSTDYTADSISKVVDSFIDADVMELESGKVLGEILDTILNNPNNRNARDKARQSFAKTYGFSSMEK